MSYPGPFPLPLVAGGTNQTTAPAFSVYLNTGVSNVTGDGTTYTVLFDTILTNVGSGYAAGTGIFTASVAGNYFFSTQLEVNNLSVLHTSGFAVYFAVRGGVTYEWKSRENTANIAVSGTNAGILSNSIVIPLAVNDTVKITTTVSGSTKTVGVTGAGGNTSFLFTYFSGYLLR